MELPIKIHIYIHAYSQVLLRRIVSAGTSYYVVVIPLYSFSYHHDVSTTCYFAPSCWHLGSDQGEQALCTCHSLQENSKLS